MVRRSYKAHKLPLLGLLIALSTAFLVLVFAGSFPADAVRLSVNCTEHPSPDHEASEILINITNKGRGAVWLTGGLNIQFRDKHKHDEFHDFSSKGLTLPKGGHQQISLQRALSPGDWRVELTAVSESQIGLKTKLRKALPHWTILQKWTAEYFALRPVYVYSDWVQGEAK